MKEFIGISATIIALIWNYYLSAKNKDNRFVWLILTFIISIFSIPIHYLYLNIRNRKKLTSLARVEPSTQS